MMKSKRSRELPSLKAKPHLLPGVLQRIRDNAGDYRKMEEEVALLWQKDSERARLPAMRNSLRAVFGPSLRHLEFVRGEGDELRITAIGKQLLRAHKKGGLSAFKRAFAGHLLTLDRERGVGVIFVLHELGGTASRVDLLARLRSKYPIESCISLDRLTKFLSYYAYAGLIKFDKGLIRLRRTQFRNCLGGVKIDVSDQDFTRALIQECEKLRSEDPANPYVPIPDLRDRVCEKTGIWLDDFDTMLERIQKETPDYLIHLTQPMLRKSGGMKLAGRYMYYIGIFRKGEKDDGA